MVQTLSAFGGKKFFHLFYCEQLLNETCDTASWFVGCWAAAFGEREGTVGGQG